MKGYDTLELDINMECVGDGEYGDCPPWDYLVYLHLCEDDNPDSCPVEFGRWIKVPIIKLGEARKNFMTAQEQRKRQMQLGAAASPSGHMM